MAVAMNNTERMTYALNNLKPNLPDGYTLEFTNSYDIYDLRHRIDYAVTDHRGNRQKGTAYYNADALSDSETWGIHIFDKIMQSVDWLMALTLED